jgi:plastocyanin
MHIGVGTIGRTVAVVAVAAVLGACGDDGGGDGASTADADVTVVAEDSLTFDQDSYTVSAGEVTIGYENAGSLTHTLVIDGIDTDDFKLTIGSSGDTDAGTVQLEPGEYRIWCDIPGHESMEATLVVE